MFVFADACIANQLSCSIAISIYIYIYILTKLLPQASKHVVLVEENHESTSRALEVPYQPSSHCVLACGYATIHT